MTRKLEHLDTARSAALMPDEPCVLEGQRGTCKACEVEYRAEQRRNKERRTLIRRYADHTQAGVLRGEVSRFAGEVVEL